MGRPAPAFWWDFSGDGEAVIVQSDYPGGDELARFTPGPGGGWEPAIRQAEDLISDFRAGRKTPAWGAFSLGARSGRH